jgi:hypothetical protein
MTTPHARRRLRAGVVPRIGFAVALVGLATTSLAAAGGATAQAAPHAAMTFKETWGVSFADHPRPVALSSPVVVNLPKGPAAVVGDRSGHLYAIYLAPTVKGRPVSAFTDTMTDNIGIDSSPSTIGGAIYFGVGWAGTRGVGGYEAVDLNGAKRWFHFATNPTTDHAGPHAGVGAGMAVGYLQDQLAVVAGSLGQNTYMFNASSGALLKGFPWYQADTNFSTAAIADVEGIPGQNQIIEGGNTSAGLSYDTQYVNGGQIRILSQNGNGGGRPNAGLYCDYAIDQGVSSSPAVGDILPGFKPGIVFGTSTDRAGVADTDDVFAVNSHCDRVWQATLDGATLSSPALADVLGNGDLQVIEGTLGGTVYALSSTTGGVHWRTQLPSEIIGGVVTADLGTGYQDVIAPTTTGAYILDGRTGRIVATLERGVGLQNSPLVTRDPNGTLGITVAGYSGSAATQHGVMEHFELVGSKVSTVSEAGAWPEFHHDPQLTGNANVAKAGPAADGGKRAARIGSAGVHRAVASALTPSLSASTRAPAAALRPQSQATDRPPRHLPARG